MTEEQKASYEELKRRLANAEAALQAIRDGQVDTVSREAHIKQMLLSAGHVLDSEGKALHSVSVQTDITDRKQTEDALRESELRYRTVADFTHDWETWIDPDGRIIYCSPSVLRLTGYSAEEIKDNPNLIESMIHPDDRAEVASHLLEELSDMDTVFQMDFRLLTKDGQERWVSHSCVPVFDDQMRFLGRRGSTRDITDRKLVEEMLQQTLDATTDGIWYWHFPTNRLTFSHRYYTMLGYEPDEFPPTYENWLDLIHPKDRSSALAVAEEYLQTKPDLYENEFRLRMKNGEYRWMYTRARVVERAADGAAVLMIGNHEDITERKNTEEALRESEGKLRAMFNAVPLAVVLLDRHGRVIDSNDEHAARLQMTREQIMGKCMWDFLPTSVRAHRKMQTEVVFETGEPFSGEDEREGIWNEYYIQPAITNERGKVEAVIVGALDITNRKRAEEAVRDSERQKNLILNATAEMVAYYDTNLRVIWANRASAESVGKSPEELVGLHCYEIWFQRDEPCPNCPVLKARDENAPQQAEQQTPDGRYRFLRGYPVLDAEGKVVALVEFGQDITERKRAEAEKAHLEEQVRQGQKMEAIGRLAGGVAHDFNNMLGIIIANAEMAAMQSNPDEPIHQSLQEILKASHRAADTVRQLLTFARKQTISPKVLDLNETVPGVLKMLRRLIGEDIDLRWMPGKDVWKVRMDPSQIQQILANLVVNSRDAMPGGGTITIESANMAVDESNCRDHEGFIPGAYVLLSVSDMGTGMTPEVVEQLFDPFFTTKEVGRGTGLGLATVYGIVKQNNGFIYVYSEAGQGTTFKIYLPRFEGEAVVIPEKAVDMRVPEGGETVLVAEDEEGLLNACNSVLERQGYTVLVARKPGEALVLAEQHPGEIHLLLSDVVMPEMNGRELWEKLQALRPSMKCLFMSGYTSNVVAHHGVLDRGVDFIEKPFSFKELAGKVREMLDKG